MWHEHGLSDLDWLPEMQAERRIVAEQLGQAAAFLTSVQSIASEEFEGLGYVTQETKDKLNEAHLARYHIIRRLTEIALEVHEAEA